MIEFIVLGIIGFILLCLFLYKIYIDSKSFDCYAPTSVSILHRPCEGQCVGCSVLETKRKRNVR